MVTVIDYSVRQSGEGKDVYFIVLQGQPEFVKSANTSKVYMTSRRASVITTFSKTVCKSLIGAKYPGSIKKVPCEEYEYTVPETKEVITLDFRYEYSDEPANIEETVFETAFAG